MINEQFKAKSQINEATAIRFTTNERTAKFALKSKTKTINIDTTIFIPGACGCCLFKKLLFTMENVTTAGSNHQSNISRIYI